VLDLVFQLCDLLDDLLAFGLQLGFLGVGKVGDLSVKVIDGLRLCGEVVSYDAIACQLMVLGSRRRRLTMMTGQRSRAETSANEVLSLVLYWASSRVRESRRIFRGITYSASWTRARRPKDSKISTSKSF